MDSLTKEKRSWNMSLIKAKNTVPEIIIQDIVRKLGLKFAVHNPILPGKPDIVLKEYKIAVFLNGCFWHQHLNCRRANIPKSNKKYWIPKLERNVKRDRMNQKELKKKGWHSIILWECQTKDPENLKLFFINKLLKYLSS